MIANDRQIEIYNYEGLVILPISSNPDGILIDPGTLDNPTIEIMSFSELKINNSRTDFFKIGRLRFREDEEDEIYEALNIKDKENIMSEQNIREFLLNDSNENLKRIKELKSLPLLTRIKKVLFQMGMSKQYNISNKLVAIINQRYEELKFDPTGSSNINLDMYIAKNPVEELENQKRTFENMMNKMKEDMMNQFKKEMGKLQEENNTLKNQLKDKNKLADNKKDKNSKSNK